MGSFGNISYLNKLEDLISGYITKLNLSRSNLLQPSKKYRTEHNLEINKARAAKTILHIWRKHKIRQTFERNPYLTYLSWINEEDEQKILSSVMYGRRIAEFKKGSERRVENPYPHHSVGYHRNDDLSGPLLSKLIEEMGVTDRIEDSVFIPVILLKNLPIQEVADKLFPKMGSYSYEFIKNEKKSIGLIVIKKNNPYRKRIIQCLTSSGLIASPWELAINTTMENENFPKDVSITQNYDNLPRSYDQLLKDSIFEKLVRLSKKDNTPVKKLSESLIKILNNFPGNMKEESVRRISIMIDMANTFYQYDYPRFAFIVYSIMHEVSLSLETQADEKLLKESYKKFLKESKQTLEKISGIGINGSHDKFYFVASPAMSGTNAYSLATKLASKMKTTTGEEPTIKMTKPSYFEFGFVTKSTQKDDADIFLISAGPIVNLDGLTPGTDINKFVRSHFIKNKREKHGVIIVDASSSLYENLNLEEDVKKLIYEGKLSIIVIESHQKFGMLHADQAQYGRMFSLCSKEHFNNEIINEMRARTEVDYQQHLDMRIGAFFSYTCEEILEDIKKQHFSNGALFRNILTQTSLISKEVVTHRDMLKNLEKLYFITTEDNRLIKASKSVLEARDSFAHFSDTWTNIDNILRISAGASDNIDCLIQATQIYLAYHFSPKITLNFLINLTKEKKSLNLSSQIILLALGTNTLLNSQNLNMNERIILMFSLSSLIDNCSLLKGRGHYNRLTKKYFEFKKNIIEFYKVTRPTSFFKTIEPLINRGISLTNTQLEQLAKNTSMRIEINQNYQNLSNIEIVSLLDFFNYLTEGQRALAITNKEFLASLVEIRKGAEKIFFILEKEDREQSITNTFLTTCFSSLETFYKSNKGVSEKNNLSLELNKATKNYCDVFLEHIESKKQKAIRYILKGLINALSVLTLGIAHAINYKITGSGIFYSGSSHERAIKRANHSLLNKLPISKNKP